MNVGNALGFPVPTPSVKRTDASKTANETDAPRSAHNSAQFAAFLNLIVGNDPKLRSSLIKQLPGDGSDLLDHIMAGASETFETGEGQASPQFFSVTSTGIEANNVVANTPSTAPITAMPATADAVRYGSMTEMARFETAASEALARSVVPRIGANSEATLTIKVEPKAATATTEYKLTRAEVNSINRTLMGEVMGSMPFTGNSNFDTVGVNDAGAGNRISQATLARLTSRKSPSIEELLAAGDRETASVKVRLDEVLSKSGTEEGLLLAAAHAASIALNAALAASAADVNTPVKDVEVLDPELRNRLERVIGRMKNEFGHEVTIVETARSQERQDVLYAQGRSTPGNIVTQTQDSKHTLGEAVDVLVDGNWDNQKGFSRLQQIAKEEGLKTLGMADPGHLELPKDSWTMNTDVRVTSISNDTPVSSGIARVASVARVASIGGGMPSAPMKAESPVTTASPSTISTNGAAGLMPQLRDANSQKNSQSSDASDDSPSHRSAVKAPDKSTTRAATPSYQEVPTEVKGKLIGPVDDVQKPSGTSAADAVDRVHDINALREQQGAKPVSHITMEVENPDGTSQQVRLDVRGNNVETNISTDSVNADRLRTHASELKTGLESRGLESDSVRINTQNVSATNAADSVKHNSGVERDAMRLAGSNASGSNSTGDQASQQNSRDRSSSARDWEGKQATRDEQRAQNRDAQGRGSGNQDRQRPQYQEKK